MTKPSDQARGDTAMNRSSLENPVLGYVVAAVALITGMIAATGFGQSPADGERKRVAQIQKNAAPGGSGAATVTGSPRRWILGVRANPTPAGYLVLKVIEGSAAEKAGLCKGDRVLAIGGSQVGWVGNQLVRLEKRVDQSSSPNTTLLVQRSSTGMVTNCRAKLQTLHQSLGH